MEGFHLFRRAVRACTLYSFPWPNRLISIGLCKFFACGRWWSSEIRNASLWGEELKVPLIIKVWVEFANKEWRRKATDVVKVSCVRSVLSHKDYLPTELTLNRDNKEWIINYYFVLIGFQRIVIGVNLYFVSVGLCHCKRVTLGPRLGVRLILNLDIYNWAEILNVMLETRNGVCQDYWFRIPAHSI